MRKIVVLGAGRFGWSLARQLTRLGADVLVLDSDETKVNQADEVVAQAACVDIRDEEALKRFNLSSVDIAVVAIGENIEGSLLAATILQRFGVREVWVRAVSDVQAQILQALGVDRILKIEEEMGKQVAYSLVNPGLHAFLSITPNHSVVQMRAKPPFVGKTLREIDFRNRHGVNVVAIRNTRYEKARDGSVKPVEHINDLPGGDDVIGSDDVLVLIGSDENLALIQKM